MVSDELKILDQRASALVPARSLLQHVNMYGVDVPVDESFLYGYREGIFLVTGSDSADINDSRNIDSNHFEALDDSVKESCIAGIVCGIRRGAQSEDLSDSAIELELER